MQPARRHFPTCFSACQSSFSSCGFSPVNNRGKQGVAGVVAVVIGWRPRLVLSSVEHVLVPPQIVPGTQT